MDQPPPRRKRGAQPGNRNARKYGLYAPVPLPDSGSVPSDSLTEALALKIFMTRVIAAAHPADDIRARAAALRALVRAAVLIARLAPPASPLLAQADRDLLAALSRLDP